MVDDGLCDTKRYGFPIPDVVLAQHDIALKAAILALSEASILTAVDSLEVRIFGKSARTSHADVCVDPIVTANHIIARRSHDRILESIKCVVSAECETSRSLRIKEPVFEIMRAPPDPTNTLIVKDA